MCSAPDVRSSRGVQKKDVNAHYRREGTFPRGQRLHSLNIIFSKF
jgi:hypothetical protein